MFDVHVAHEWGITPDTFYDKPARIQALMAAYVISMQDMAKVGN